MSMGKTLRLPQELRQRFAVRLGQVLKGSEITREALQALIPEDTIIVTVGDVTSATLLKLRIRPDICLVDNATLRGPSTEFDDALDEYLDSLEDPPEVETILVSNPKECITSQLWEAVWELYQNIANKKIYKSAQTSTAREAEKLSVVTVDGEEDLGIIPAIIEAPPATIIIYGIPGLGIDIFEPDEAKKNEARDIVAHMEEEHGT